MILQNDTCGYIFIHGWGAGGVDGNQFPTFDAEFKFAKIQNSHVEDGWVGGGGWWKPISNFWCWVQIC